MATKIRKCRFPNCLHESREINLDTDEYVVVGKSSYYHKDCKEEADNMVCCSYRNCKHKSMIDIRKDEFIKDGNTYWHPDCKHESDTMQKIIDFWYRNIDADETNFGNLQRIVRKIVDKGDSIDFVLFALERKVAYLKHPPGLFYAVNDYKLKEEWARRKLASDKKKGIVPMKPVTKQEKVYDLGQQTKKNNFADIFGGM